ncbi:DNA-binding transcriptional regulator, LysR family [Vibrio xiamenensis]|uniref:DNA-binding transcriptional regulator, LysR family n=1 Tax=Vibrio xiamenensis TaxID=861298 RepID=A0A1G8CGV4_9VIBR|nr:LysR family transcriptional regulator [Vibrio xiamenensis]SDH44632.1 DNA-binding transcriptional regulator, LysR family [Vibrio xiamenensis]
MESTVNLNLINLLILLKKNKTMRMVAKILGKSESAVSKDLSKLRKDFNDVLFIKTQNGYEPSHYLNQIFPELEAAYLQLTRVVNKPLEFDPDHYDELITIAIADAEYDLLLDALYPKLVKYFPQAKFNFVSWNSSCLHQILDGKIQCGIHLWNEHVSQDIYQKTIKTDQIVAAMHRDYGVTDWQTLKDMPFVFIDVPGWNEFNYRFEQILPAEHRGEVQYKIRVDKMKSALRVATHSQIAVQFPTRYLSEEFTVIAYPNDVKFNIAYTFYCAQTERSSPLIKLIHQLIKECYQVI